MECAEKVAARLRGIAVSVRIVELPGLPKGGDVSDWLDAGGDAQQLVALCEAAPPLWEPTPLEHSPEQSSESGVLIPYCDEALTLAFSARHADDLRYCETFGAWFEWQTGGWREDITGRVFSHARRLCRDKSAEALTRIENQKTAAKIASLVASAKTVAAVVNLERSDARHATAPDDWDADPWALNTPDGIVDLRTRQTRPHDRTALCSKMTAVARRPTRRARVGSGSSTMSPPATRSCSAFSAASPAMASPARPASMRCSSSTSS